MTHLVSLLFDAGGIEQVIVTQKLDEFALRLVKTGFQVADESECARVAHVTYRNARLLRDRRHNIFDCVVTTVIANNDLQMTVALAHGTVERALEKTRIEGRNNKADKGK